MTKDHTVPCRLRGGDDHASDKYCACWCHAQIPDIAEIEREINRQLWEQENPND